MVEEPAFTALRSWAYYQDPLRQAIQGLKYRRNISLGNILSIPLIEIVNTEGWQVDLVIPVPLSAERHTERGYNQAAMLAYPIALSLGVEYQPGSLRRTRNTPSQVGLNGRERRENVIGAFLADADLARGKHVLLVDDVATTGTTLAECSRALKAAGAQEVFALTLARAGRFPVE